MLALLLAACSGAQCPQPESAERSALRSSLIPFIHVSQCDGSTPAVFHAQAVEMTRRQAALLERIGSSPLAEDLARAKREDQEASKMVHEAECDTTYWDKPDAPGNVALYRAKLDYDRQALQTAEAAFSRAIAGCPAS